MGKEIFTNYIDSPIGILKISSNQLSLNSISFVESKSKVSLIQPEILKNTEKQLKSYFEGTRKEFDLMLSPRGTEFQNKIWNLVKEVTFGNTTTYLDIAKKSGSALNTRAVGMANGKNPIPIIIPCHRIIGSNGKLTGYAGGIERKKWLLQHEIKFSNSNYTLF